MWAPSARGLHQITVNPWGISTTAWPYIHSCVTSSCSASSQWGHRTDSTNSYRLFTWSQAIVASFPELLTVLYYSKQPKQRRMERPGKVVIAFGHSIFRRLTESFKFGYILLLDKVYYLPIHFVIKMYWIKLWMLYKIVKIWLVLSLPRHNLAYKSTTFVKQLGLRPRESHSSLCIYPGIHRHCVYNTW